MVMKNPFVTNGYAGPEYFCDRMEETQHITEMLTNENNMSPSSVNSALKGLLEKDFITQQDDAYVVYDKFFDLWLKKYLK